MEKLKWAEWYFFRGWVIGDTSPKGWDFRGYVEYRGTIDSEWSPEFYFAI